MKLSWPPLRSGTVMMVLGWMLSGLELPSPAADWPQFLGPNRDGVSTESFTFEAGFEPVTLWTREVGGGFGGPVVVGNRVLLHHRRGDQAVLEAWKVQDGTSLWTHTQPAAYRDDFGFDDGPRATPTVIGERVFTFGADGRLTCVDLTDGRMIWTVEAGKALGADKGFFGFAGSPLVHKDLVLVSVGGKPGAGLAAFDVGTGEVRWKSGDHEAGYASPVLAELWGTTQAVCFTRDGLRVIDPKTGASQCEYPWRSRQHASVNAATPLVIGQRIFLTASYGTGAILLDLSTREPTRVWSGDQSLSSHYASVVQRDGLIFGFHGRQEQGASLRCVEARTGKVRWSHDGLGSGSVLISGDALLVLSERGEWLAVDAKAPDFRVLARAQVLGSGTRAFSAIADGRWYGRDPRKLVALDLRPGSRR